MKKGWLLLMAVAMLGCQSVRQEPSSDLVVVEQTDSVNGGREENNYCSASINIDAPVNGPQALVDSVLVLINRELYRFCEACVHFEEGTAEIFSKDEVYVDGAEDLLARYMKKYKPLLQDSLWNSFGLDLKMEAQTASYVTYGLVNFHCGASCGSEKYFYTFDKRDGHQVKEIISHDNLVRFFEDYPEYKKVEGYGWEFSPESEFDNLDYGLVGDHFSLIIIGWYNHFFSEDIPFGQIFSYLSPEAQQLVKQNEEEGPMLPAYLPERSEDDQVWMDVDTVNHALLGYVSAAGGPLVDTLMHYGQDMELYPKRVFSVHGAEGTSIYLFAYSLGHLLYCDEVMVCAIDEGGLQPATLFSYEGQKDSVISCMWYDQLVEASDGFPFDELDEDRFGIHYDPYTKRLYIPVMENHEEGSGYENCLRYTGRFDVLQFNGREFVPVGTDGAWWLNPDLRNYQRTISNHKTSDGIEQTDLMPDGTYRHAVWKGAKTLDDLRKKPDEVKISKNKDF